MLSRQLSQKLFLKCSLPGTKLGKHKAPPLSCAPQQAVALSCGGAAPTSSELLGTIIMWRQSRLLRPLLQDELELPVLASCRPLTGTFQLHTNIGDCETCASQAGRFVTACHRAEGERRGRDAELFFIICASSHTLDTSR